jgi:hypothetical protein
MGSRALLAAASAALLTVVVPAATPHLATRAAAAATNPGTVRTWNLHALDALVNQPTAPVPGAGQTPGTSELHLAMVQGAVYDAVNSIDGGHQPYLTGLPPASPSASLEAAVATAAHHVLVGLGGGLVPALPQVVRDRLDALYAEELAGIPDGQPKTDGISAGAVAAAAMLAARAHDGRYVPFSFIVGDDPGEWRPTPPAFINDPNAWLARVEPFVLTTRWQFQSKGPRRLTSAAYATEYNEVKTLGAVNSVRSPAQEAVTQFFTNNVSPFELFNRTFRTISQREGLTLVQDARLFAMVNLAAADAAINCWSDKDHFSFWRPITAIQLGDDDGNPATAGDPAWTPLLTTPPYPEHTSGYNCATGSMMHTAKAFFGTDRMDFDLVRIVPGTPNVTRSYRHFTDVIDDTIDARVYQGVHFRSADVQGAGIGKNVARWLAQHFFQPA